ncbi:glycosyltransferase family 1 protein [Rathayibacter rathayi]|uniref:Glycosyltransferase family 1 protein n=1 Tax=Rathayibacter rathayi TaxID=33887 RepID=A0ABD6WB43_RATRA|nr:glycosyltransferase family 1 protein [Rathayibacter rathayi]AZZ49341.1 glycosyltransferase family 1 protein [Rathayibacter rathayi]MWV73433.1 glycosyltransferase [Rathayibacter rathayi NCPPB 2980 = VKM Ac-1601]PPF15011.1 glycosyltransferase family 1 protein [Rathayibacter rathayi]PPF24587.1 glycosyltransferase family 1 protein [Rathayibacter rathayi]PPF50304.1 glycosyltransferase family 1 protein [Rathayibacter rathayi]
MRSKQYLVDRLATLVRTLAPSVEPLASVDALTGQLSVLLPAPTDREVWLVLAVLRGTLPRREDVVDGRRRARLDGTAALLAHAASTIVSNRVFARFHHPDVQVVVGAVVVDVHHTARTGLATGIQRVVRQSLVRWTRDHEVLLAGWDSSHESLVELTPEQSRNAISGDVPDAAEDRSRVIVPWQGTYLLPELAVEDERTSRVSALAEFSGNRTGTIGFDCVPVTTAETASTGISAAFSRTLVAVSHMDRIATISEAAATEYSGWRHMLGSVGMQGPDIRAVLLPSQPESVSEEELSIAARSLVTGDLPLVVCVGSHEPRKNHLAVLQAAELLWRRGLEFSLVFIGGNAWSSAEFEYRLEVLEGFGRPVRSLSKITDALLWSAYRLARCTVFPSINEGYGLPIVESISVGTPVVTSGFGSMREVSSSGGALFVDPHDDHDIASALGRLLSDDELHARLSAEALAIDGGTWDEYAERIWSYLVEEDATGRDSRTEQARATA